MKAEERAAKLISDNSIFFDVKETHDLISRAIREAESAIVAVAEDARRAFAFVANKYPGTEQGKKSSIMAEAAEYIVRQQTQEKP